MAPIEISGLVIDDELQQDFGTACLFITFLSVVSLLISFMFDLHVGKELTLVPSDKVTVEQRIDAMDKVLLTPLFGVIGCMALYASLELRVDVTSRWSGSTPQSRWCSLMYCAKMLLDVPTQLWTLRKDNTKRAQMVGHHALSFVAIGSGLVLKRSNFWACWAVCSELSTPFLNLVMAIKLFGGNKTPLQNTCHTCAGAGLWLCYIPFRMALFPYWLKLWFEDLATYPAETSAISSLFELYFFPAVIVFLLVLSTVWFVAITKGLWKALFGKKGVSKKTK